MKKILISLMILCIGLSVQAKPLSVKSAISESGINKDAISVSVKDVNNGKSLFELNEKTPFRPASTQKVITSTVSADSLGSDFEFKTSLYKNDKDELILTLGGDPYLKRNDLLALMKLAKKSNIVETEKIYVDDYVMDSLEWGEGWQWDDDLNPLMPKFSSYNLDKNLLTAIIDPTIKGSVAKINLTTFYPITFMNLTVTGGNEKFSVERSNYISPDILTVRGGISARTSYTFPVNNTRRYFLIKLEEAISEAGMSYYGDFQQIKTPEDKISLIGEIKNPINIALKDILKNSDNFVAESLFKIAGGKFVNNTGAIKNSVKMFDEYCKKHNLNNENVKLVDGSGVSKNNLMTANFMTDFLVEQAKKENFEEYMKLLPTAGEGSLQNRMLYFKGNIYAKTGTLSDISAICGYLKTKKGNLVAFDIMINDAKSSSSDKKASEEQIIRAIYNKY